MALQKPFSSLQALLPEGAADPKLLPSVRFLTSWFGEMLFSPNLTEILDEAGMTPAQYTPVGHEQVNPNTCVQVASWERARLAWLWNVGQNQGQRWDSPPRRLYLKPEMGKHLQKQSGERTKNWKCSPIRTGQRKATKKD